MEDKITLNFFSFQQPNPFNQAKALIYHYHSLKFTYKLYFNKTYLPLPPSQLHFTGLFCIHFEQQYQMGRLLILFYLLLCVWGYDYTSDHFVNCSNINTTSTYDNLNSLWGIAILHNIDRYLFLVACPIILILQLMIIIIYSKHSNLMQSPRNIFFGIVAFELLINLHFFATSIYYTIEFDSQTMPSSFPTFCMVNAFYASFLEIIHMQFLLLFPLYIIYILRFTLKNSKIWNVIYVVTSLISVGCTIGLYFGDFLGLSIYGLCEITFIRRPNLSIVPLSAILLMVVLFLFIGIFTIRYYKKHMPNTIGLRRKKHKQNKILFYYFVGFLLYLVLSFAINIVELFNCRQQHQQAYIEIFITLMNLLRLLQFTFQIIIVFKNQSFRRGFKKFWKSRFTTTKTKEVLNLELNKTASFYKSHQSNIDFQEFFLDIKEEQDQLDILKVSQVVTIVSGIYVAYKQYYNIADEYFRPNLSDDSNRSDYSGTVKPKNKRPTKKIYYHEKMSIAIDSEIIKDYMVDLSLLPRLGILACNMTIHAPKVFQKLLENDNLCSIFSSFELHDNTKKMFDLVEGQGGRSGEFFFFSYDNKYVLKTITQNEFDFLEENLSYFNEHFQRNPNSLLAKIYGLFTFKGYEIQRTYHLILMKNILGCGRDQIIRTYDLKGSKYDREVNIGDTSNELEKLTLKDIDFMKMEKRLYIRNDLKADLRAIIEKDTLFLKSLNLIDYSLLIVKVRWEIEPKDPDFWGEYQRIQSSVDLETYYHIGIIDYLQKWDFQKKGEKWWKRLWGKKDISAQQPKKYQLRYMAFVNEIAESLSLNDCQFEMGQLPVEEVKQEEEADEVDEAENPYTEYSDEKEKDSVISKEISTFRWKLKKKKQKSQPPPKKEEVKAQKERVAEIENEHSFGKKGELFKEFQMEIEIVEKPSE